MPETSVFVTVDGVGAEVVTVPAGNYYLYRDGGSRDALTALETALETHTGLSSVTCFLGENRRTRITADADFRITTWTAGGSNDTTLSDLLGFSGEENISLSDSKETNYPSAYLWSPGRTESPDSPLGVNGIPMKDTAVGRSGNGIIVATTMNTTRTNSFEWRYINTARVHTSNERNGEYMQFWNKVLSTFSRFYLYREVDEDDAVSTGASLTTSIGPYLFFPSSSDGNQMDYEREIEKVDKLNRVRIPVVVANEYA